jgi:hypothetical protein
VLRAKAQQVLCNTLQRRMRTALAAWLAYVDSRAAKRVRLALAMRHCRLMMQRHAAQGWTLFLKVGVWWTGRHQESEDGSG